ncbi:hypothetical protein TrVE_jg7578 [Triparma verrucosa]|uniref:Uncharacterized protein n=1 Tax=Triparma verrucosa TaxID=1606542 RepID=A0A9W7BP67_9STRA|nr:hypothetical protein TrVE_jg7578 [Triparma verrucosa]
MHQPPLPLANQLQNDTMSAFEPDLSNTEEREAGVSKKMSTEAQEDCDSYRFLDLSNIQICAQINGDGTKDRSVRLKYDSLDELVMMARRAPVRSFCFGSRSHNDTSDSVVDKYYNENIGWDFQMFTRAPGVGEEIVDPALVAQIQATLLNVGTPQRIILMTGDGNPNGGRGVSFFKAVMMALDRGWIVEIWSWKASCNKLYKNLVGTSRFSLHYLDDFRDKITLSDVDCKPKAKPRTKLMSIDKGKGTSAINCSVPEWD